MGLPCAAAPVAQPIASITVGELILRYWVYAQEYYRDKERQSDGPH